MHKRVYKEFEKICSSWHIIGSVLEVGATPNDKSLLCMESLKNAKEKIGLNLDGPHDYKDFKIIKGNANKMDFFENEQFDAVLSNATFEHDKYFWKSISEIKRVIKPGGLVVIGTPGYSYFKIEELKKLFRKIPIINKLQKNQYLNMLFTATITFQIHSAPGDYYRFSPQTFKDVFFEDFENIKIYSIMLPPRIIGVGTKRNT